MINELKPQKLVSRDGVSQAQRVVGELDPDHIQIEERGLADFLHFANKFAAYLKYYDKNNEVAGDWSAFLSGDFAYGSPEQLDWVSRLLAYANNPQAYAGKTGLVAGPHVALFIAFLKLLDSIKSQLNGFTKQHLDFYYFNLLGLKKQGPVPDVVNFIVELTKDANELMLKKGTLITAGKDASGKDRIYGTETDTHITKAAVKQVKAIFVDKRSIHLRDKWNEKDRLQSVKEMLAMALGYDTFSPEGFQNPDKSINAAMVELQAGKYQLASEDLTAIIDLAINKESSTDIKKVIEVLKTAYRRLQIKRKRDGKSSLFALIELLLADADGKLPTFDNTTVTENVFLQINNALRNADDRRHVIAMLYVLNQLGLSLVNFNKLADLIEKREPDDKDWATVYAILDVGLQKRGVSPEPAPDTQWISITEIGDVKAAIAASSLGRFRAFGQFNAEHVEQGSTPTVGLAISSPHFVLDEGKRSIKICLSCGPTDNLTITRLRDKIRSAAKASPPFRVLLSVGEEWKDVLLSEVKFDNFILAGNGVSLDMIAISNGNLNCSIPAFSRSDAGNYVVTSHGEVFLITGYIDQKNVTVITKGYVANAVDNAKYSAKDIYLNSLCLNISIDEELAAYNAIPSLPKAMLSEAGDNPMLAVLLHDTGEQSNSAFIGWYQLLQNIVIEKIRVDMAVTGLKNLALQNDQSLINPKKPFEPFGTAPQVGNMLYFSHPQLAGKPLDALTLNFEWINAPASFEKYYAGYKKVAPEEINNSNKLITSNDHFVAKVGVVENEDHTELGNIKLFGANAAVNVKGYHKDIPLDKLNIDEDVINWKRYFTLELLTDFNHPAYPALLTKQAIAYDNADLRSITLNTPYVPKLKQLTADYTSSFELLADSADETDRLFSIDAFGFREITNNVTSTVRLVPRFENAGELFLGLMDLGRQQHLSLLFQLAEGTADPESVAPLTKWSYLKNDEWVELSPSAILSDSTNGLVNTGIVQLNIPGDINNTNHLLEDGLYWLKMSVGDNSAAVPDIIDIIAQGVSATLMDEDNDASHFTEMLEPGSVKATIESMAEIKRLEQPFASTGGKPAEADGQLYVRVSERLRHKNRALTMWDYERIILAEFPQIYKVKCMPGTFSDDPEEIGKVDIVVIANIKSELSFDSFQPKVSSAMLLRITEHLEARVPPFVSIKVRNPVYVKIRVKTGVRIRKGYSEEFYRLQLQHDIKQFLSPWAFDKTAEIIIGGYIYNNAIVNFTASLPYVDHVATIKLLQSAGNDPYREVKTVGGAAAANPDMILVSAPDHDIQLLADDEFSPTSMIGIGYMQVDNDFIVTS